MHHEPADDITWKVMQCWLKTVLEESVNKNARADRWWQGISTKAITLLLVNCIKIGTKSFSPLLQSEQIRFYVVWKIEYFSALRYRSQVWQKLISLTLTSKCDGVWVLCVDVHYAAKIHSFLENFLE